MMRPGVRGLTHHNLACMGSHHRAEQSQGSSRACQQPDAPAATLKRCPCHGGGEGTRVLSRISLCCGPCGCADVTAKKLQTEHDLHLLIPKAKEICDDLNHKALHHTQADPAMVTEVGAAANNAATLSCTPLLPDQAAGKSACVLRFV